MRELKNLYDTFLESGDLKALYPEMSGVWEEDKAEFTKQMKPAAKAFEDDTKDLADDEF